MIITILPSILTFQSILLEHSRLYNLFFFTGLFVTFFNRFPMNSPLAILSFQSPILRSDSNLYLTAFNNFLLESLDAVLPSNASFFRLHSWFDSSCSSAKRLLIDPYYTFVAQMKRGTIFLFLLDFRMFFLITYLLNLS